MTPEDPDQPPQNAPEGSAQPAGRPVSLKVVTMPHDTGDAVNPLDLAPPDEQQSANSGFPHDPARQPASAAFAFSPSATPEPSPPPAAAPRASVQQIANRMCRKCGWNNLQTAGFCFNCGADLNAQPPRQAPSPYSAAPSAPPPGEEPVSPASPAPVTLQPANPADPFAHAVPWRPPSAGAPVDAEHDPAAHLSFHPSQNRILTAPESHEPALELDAPPSAPVSLEPPGYSSPGYPPPVYPPAPPGTSPPGPVWAPSPHLPPPVLKPHQPYRGSYYNEMNPAAEPGFQEKLKEWRTEEAAQADQSRQLKVTLFSSGLGIVIGLLIFVLTSSDVPFWMMMIVFMIMGLAARMLFAYKW
ncbi:MAG: hypothetical protein GMKNLPBB_01706 [Myxococcota bacterium]|nr:hypothetical protein [Myxococcota bacterium]